MQKTKIIGIVVLSMIGFIACEQDEKVIDSEVGGEPTPYFLETPRGFPEMEIPADNQLTVEGIALGRKLFYDPILSLNSKQSCASCHNQEFGFTDNGKATSEGVEGVFGDRNAMAIINLGWDRHFFWDGRSRTVEEQAFEPVPNPIEMNISWVDALVKLNAHTEYPSLFKQAFGINEIDSTDVVKAIAQFERTVISSNSKYDLVRRGQAQLSPQEREGEAIFFSERGDCFHCHNYPFFTSGDFHNNGLQQVIVDLGRASVTNNPIDEGKFKAPTLRNIEKTGPYMHDGRFTTLEEVVEFYNSEVNQSLPTIDPLMVKSNRPGGNLGLFPSEKEALVAFLKTLTDTTFLENQAFVEPE
jgi:cytochrome c peroxidase